MLRTLKSRTVWLFGIAGIVMLVLFLSAVGCGRNDDPHKGHIAVRTTKPTTPAPAVTPPPRPEIDTTSVTAEPEEAVVTVPEPPKEVTYEEAEAAYHERRYGDAVELFTLYTERKSENPWGFYMLGLSAWKAGDHEGAEKAFEQALELDPNHVKSRLNLSRVLLDVRRSKDAMAEIDEALAIDPESGVAYRLKGRAFRQLGEIDEAIDAYRKAIQIDDQDAWAMNNLGLIYIENGLFEKALAPLARAVELKSDIAIFFNNLGMALEGTGHFRAAEDAYRSAVETDGSYFKAAINLSRVEEVLEDPGLEPVDLESIARSFVEEIESWTDVAIVGEQPESVEPGANSISVSDQASEPVGDPDSTVVSDPDIKGDGDTDSTDDDPESEETGDTDSTDDGQKP